MTPITPFDVDPLTAGWLFVLALLLAVTVVIPVLRAGIAALLYLAALVTGRAELRGLAARVMPRIAHLIGGVIIGTAAVAAPALAAPAQHDLLHAIDLDRDAGLTHALTPAPALSSTDSSGSAASVATAPSPAATTTPPLSDAKTSDQGAAVYIVHTGDTLWDIAAAQLDDPSNSEITETWKAIWRANRDVIGSNPGLILPGQELDLTGTQR